MQHRALAVALAVSLLATSLPSLADSAEVPAKYKKAYNAAVKLQNDGEYERALAAFEALPKEAQTALTRIHAAACKQRLGRWTEAARDLQTLASEPGIDRASVEVAQSDLEELRLHIPKVIVRSSAEVTDLVVTVGEATVKIGEVHELDPGKYLLRAMRGTREIYRREIAAAVDKTTEVVIDVSASTAVPVEPRPAPPPAPLPDYPRATREESGGRSVAPFVFFAVAGLAAAGAGVSFLGARSKSSQLEETCDTAAGCNEDLRADARRGNLITGIALGVAGAAAVLGVVFLVRDDSRPRTTATVAPVTGGAVLGLAGSF
jgi:hypothetical protein